MNKYYNEINNFIEEHREEMLKNGRLLSTSKDIIMKKKM